MADRIKKGVTLRTRCEPKLKEDVAKIARHHGLDESDIIRIACQKLVFQFNIQPSILTCVSRNNITN